MTLIRRGLIGQMGAVGHIPFAKLPPHWMEGSAKILWDKLFDELLLDNLAAGGGVRLTGAGEFTSPGHKDASSAVRSQVVTTTNATTTELFPSDVPFPGATDGAFLVVGRIVAFQPAADIGAAYQLSRGFRRIGSTTTALAAQVVNATHEEASSAAWDIALVTQSSGTWNATVTGEAAKTILWRGWFDIYGVNE